MSNVKKFATPKESWMAMIFLYLLFAMNANGRELTNRLAPYMSDTFGLSADQLGLIGTISGIAMAIGSIPLSKWIENGKHGGDLKRRMLVISGGYMVAMLLCGITPVAATFGIILIFQGLRGLFSAPGECGEVNTIVEWWPKEKNGFALGFHHTAYPWGTLVGGFLISGLLTVFGDENWQLMFLVFPIIGFIVMIGFWKFSTNERYKNFEESTREAGLTPPLDSVGGSEITAERASVIDVLKIRKVRTTAAIGFLCQYSYIGLMFWLPLYLSFVAGLSFASAAGLSVIYAVTGGLGQIVWGHLSDKIGVHKTLVICFAWLAIFFFLMKFCAGGIAFVVVGQLLIGCCSNAVYPVMYKRAQDAVKDNENITATSITTTGIFIGAACATYITGLFIKLGGGYESISGYNTGVIAMSLSMVLALIILVVSDALDKRDEKKAEGRA